jgi:hypothetical protein
VALPYHEGRVAQDIMTDLRGDVVLVVVFRRHGRWGWYVSIILQYKIWILILLEKSNKWDPILI